MNNYHTHTARCHHAIGWEEEYIQYAISRGVKTLGFSDHAPMPFRNGEVPFYQMEVEELPGYITSLLSLREKYSDKIHILIGFETEYYQDAFLHFLSMIKSYPIDYLLLGQHFLGEHQDEDGVPCSVYTEDRARLSDYVNQVLAGLQTGCFSYLAHPDLLHFSGDAAYYEKEMLRLCQAAKQMEIPLELNLLGLAEKRHYPNDKFWQVASSVGCKVILGCDAHEPFRVADPQEIEWGRAYLKQFSLPLIETLTLRPIQFL